MFASFSLGLALLPFASAAIHNIQVGDGATLTFSPEAIAAQPGDQVLFTFKSKNHTVTQSSFPDPCGLKEGGFDSGFMPVQANQTDGFPTYTINVQDTQPIWVHCRQKTPANHCGMGMVFAVNCGLDGAPNSFTNFKKAALAIGAAQASASPSASAGGYGYGGGGGGYGGGYGSPPPAASAEVWTTAAYGGYTIPAAPQATPVTQTVTLGDQVWTTTYNSYPGSPDPTPAAAAGNVITVKVGGPGKLAFDPPSVQAKPRDTVVFQFLQKNHSVIQSSFADPCRPLNANGATGFNSGFNPVADTATTFPTWNFTVLDTAPVWAYCGQTTPASHCGAGMLFAINAVESSERSFSAFQNVAKSLNGTTASDNTTPSPSGSAAPNNNANGAAPVHLGGATATIAVAAIIALFL